MTIPRATLVTLGCDLPQPGGDTADLRLDPDAVAVDDEHDFLMARREQDGQLRWIAQDVAGKRRVVSDAAAQYAFSYASAPPVIRVFLSSTFRDMAVERNHLIQTVFPRLKQLAQEHGITLQEIDLRWGVTEEQVHQGATVAICLDEIDKCRGYPPFFVGLLGERYGWIPDAAALDALDRQLADPDASADLRRQAREQGMSVTEMEIRYGVLAQPQARRHAFFYTRARALTEQLSQQPGMDPAQYFSPEHDGRQDALKAELAAQGLLRIDGYRSVLALGDDIERMIAAAIVRLARSQMRVTEQTATALPDGYEVHADIDQGLRDDAIALARDLRDWDDFWRWMDRQPVAPRLLLLGPAGIGKRTHVQRHVLAYNLSVARLTLHCRAGYVHNTESACHYLRTALASRQLVPAWQGPARMGLREALDNMTARFTIVVTDVDLLDDGRELVELLGLVENTALCIAITASDPGYARDAGMFAVRHLGMLDRHDRLIFIDSYLSRFRKTLASSHAQRLADLPLAGSPAVLRLLLEELRRDATFETLSAMLDTYAALTTQQDLYRHALATWLRHVDPDGAHAEGWHIALETLYLAVHGVPDGFFTAADGAGLPPLSWAVWLGLAAPVVVAVGQGWQLRDAVIRQVIGEHHARPQRRLAARRRLAHALITHGVGRATELAEITSQLLAVATASQAPDDIDRLRRWMLSDDAGTAVSTAAPALAATAWRSVLQQDADSAALDALVTRCLHTERDTALLIPLLYELAAWPALERLLRPALAVAPAAQNTELIARLATAIWLQGRTDEAAALLAPSLQAWLAAPDQPPPDTLGTLMAMATGGDLAIEPWMATLDAGVQALLHAAMSGTPVSPLLMMSALPLVIRHSGAKAILGIAMRCLTFSYDLPGHHALTLRLMALEALMGAFLQLGNYAAAADVGGNFLDVTVRDAAQTQRHGRCARMLAAALIELQRWDEALAAIDFAREYELPHTGSAEVKLAIEALLALCLLHCQRVDDGLPWLELFLQHAAAAPDHARALGAVLEQGLRGAGAAAAADRLGRELPLRLAPR